MNETTWLRETDPLRLLADRYPMRGHDSTQPQPRQSRLYLLACARKFWPRLPAVCRAMVWLGEVHADAPRECARIYEAVTPVTERLMTSSNVPDDARSAELELLGAEHIPAERDRAWRAATAPTAPAPPLSPAEWHGVTVLLHLAFEPLTPTYMWVSPDLHDVDLLREVHGNPYRRVVFREAWRTSTAVSLARQMYESREFSAMPILADALQDAGCDSEDVLKHCRSGKPHARGCWVVDLVLEQ